MAVSGKEERYNIRPAVEVTAPAEGASFSPGADFKITAEAYDNDGSVALVEFFQDDTKLGEDDTSPYEFTWSSVPAGTYSITARAVDNGGAVNTSCHVTITVGSGI
ncbi:MAG TPA: Ig-like domain-containing protein [archaeon]|nr:Ig-like domain-containing protein [archaeon]